MILNNPDLKKAAPLASDMDIRRRDSPPQLPPPPPVTGDGSSIELPKRPRGRPPGSKNRPKPPVIITRESEPSAAMRPHVLEIPSGHDVVSCLARFSRRRKLGICVLAAAGAVANVTVRHPGAEAAIAFHGRFDILSLSATLMPQAEEADSPPAPGLSIALAGPQGHVIGGSVVGPLLAVGPVMVVAATFADPIFHRLPEEEDVSVSVSVSGVKVESADAVKEQQYVQEEQQQQQQRYFHHFHLQQPQSSPSPPPPVSSTAAEASGIALYGAHFSPEILWPRGGRPPHSNY